MDGPAPAASVKSLRLADDDDHFLFSAIVDSFGVSFPRMVPWETLGEVHEALLARLPVSAQPGACATSMAFWRLRRVLDGTAPQGARLTPATPLKAVVNGEPPRRFFARLKCETGLELGRAGMGWTGCLGVTCMILGTITGMTVHSQLVGWGSVAGGVGMMLLDQGSYGASTLGGLARKLARANAGRLIREGADARPQTVWRTLCEIVAEETEIEGVAGLTPQTRLS